MIFQRKIKSKLNQKIQDTNDLSFGTVTSIKITLNTIFPFMRIQLCTCLLIFGTIKHFQVVLNFMGTTAKTVNTTIYLNILNIEMQN